MAVLLVGVRARVFWTLVGCTVAGDLPGTLVLRPLWIVFGLPVA